MAMVPLPAAHADYATLDLIASAIVASGGGYAAFAQKVPEIFRQAIDEVIDAPRTGRYTIEETEKTEKTYLGTKVEILLRNYLKLPKGKILDLTVGGVEVDIKNTMGRTWTIPLESMGHPALLLRSREKTARCDVGLIVIKDNYLNPGLNRDSKRTISADGTANIWWLLRDSPYPPNFWEILSISDRAAIVNAGAGTARIAALFERILLKPISRSQVQALAQQHDYMKRVRKNGGARDLLAPKGIALLWGGGDQAAIQHLNLGLVTRDQFISIKPIDPAEIAFLRSIGHID